MLLTEIRWVDPKSRTAPFGAALPRTAQRKSTFKQLPSSPTTTTTSTSARQQNPPPFVEGFHGERAQNANQKGVTSPIHHLLPFLYFLNSHFQKIIQIFFFFLVTLSAPPHEAGAGFHKFSCDHKDSRGELVANSRQTLRRGTKDTSKQSKYLMD